MLGGIRGGIEGPHHGKGKSSCADMSRTRRTLNALVGETSITSSRRIERECKLNLGIRSEEKKYDSLKERQTGTPTLVHKVFETKGSGRKKKGLKRRKERRRRGGELGGERLTQGEYPEL